MYLQSDQQSKIPDLPSISVIDQAYRFPMKIHTALQDPAQVEDHQGMILMSMVGSKPTSTFLIFTGNGTKPILSNNNPHLNECHKQELPHPM